MRFQGSPLRGFRLALSSLALLALLGCGGGYSSSAAYTPPPITDVYVVGIESDGNKDIAKLWKNGTATRLTNAAQDATGLGLFVHVH